MEHLQADRNGLVRHGGHPSSRNERYQSLQRGSYQHSKNEFGSKFVGSTKASFAFLMKHSPSFYASMNFQEIAANLAHFKTFPVFHSEPPRRPMHGIGCGCMPFSNDSFTLSVSTNPGLRNLLNVPTQNRNNYFITRRCYYVVYCLGRKTKFDYAKLTNASIIEDGRVQEAIQKYVKEEMEEQDIPTGSTGRIYSELVARQGRNAGKILQNMKAALSSTMIRIAGYVLFKVFGCLFSSVTVTEGQLQMIETAAKRNLPLIFVPLHRSHVDYLFVTWVLFNREIPAPLVAAGDNLRIPIFGWILRSLGGFFIKRRLDSVKSRKDLLYRSLLQSYMSKALLSGYNLEFFIEGGRTRTGKPYQPKGGLLSVIIDAYLNGKLDDALIVPIAINYDKLPDGNFVREQLGRGKVPESFWRAVRAITKVLSTNFGHARIDFSQPFSLKEFFQSSKVFIPNVPHSESLAIENSSLVTSTTLTLKSRDLSSSSAASNKSSKTSLHATRSSSSLFGTEVTEEYRTFVRTLAQHIVYDAEKCQAIMSTNVVSWILAYWYRNGETLSKVVDAVSHLRNDLTSRGRDTGFSGDSLDVTIHAVKLLGSLVQVKGNLSDNPESVFICACNSIPASIELQYYCNALLPLYAGDAIVATALSTIVGCDLFSYEGVNTTYTISYTKLMDRAKRLCDILKFEFIFVPYCKSLESKLYGCLERLIECGLVVSEEKPARRLPLYYDDCDSSDSETHTEVYYKLLPNRSNMKTVAVLTRVLSPLIEAYYATTCNLVSLIDRPLPENDFVDETQTFITNLLLKGALLYGESVAAEPIKNALKNLESEHIIELYPENSVRLIYLNKNYESEEKLYPFMKEIESFRL